MRLLLRLLVLVLVLMLVLMLRAGRDVWLAEVKDGGARERGNEVLQLKVALLLLRVPRGKDRACCRRRSCAS